MQNEAELIDPSSARDRIIVAGTLRRRADSPRFAPPVSATRPHGAGLSRPRLLPEWSFVYESLPRNYPNIEFRTAWPGSGLDYAADLFEAPAPQSTRAAVAEFDIGRVAARLDTIRTRIAATPRIGPRWSSSAGPETAEPGAAPSEPAPPNLSTKQRLQLQATAIGQSAPSQANRRATARHSRLRLTWRGSDLRADKYRPHQASTPCTFNAPGKRFVPHQIEPASPAPCPSRHAVGAGDIADLADRCDLARIVKPVQTSSTSPVPSRDNSMRCIFPVRTHKRRRRRYRG